MRLDDGFPTLVTFTEVGMTFWEKTVTPPELTAGGPNDTTTMRNNRMRTKAPKRLLSLTEASLTVAYDPIIYAEGMLALGVNQPIIVTFSDGAELEFWGWMDNFKPNEIKEGEQPTATITVQCSNQDSNGFEVEPVYALP